MISVVVPCYNCEKSIDICVDSLRNQSAKEFEVILVDDGSTDATGKRCDETEMIDHRFIAVHQNNGGLVNAWKTGVRSASGEYIIFCDADDYVDNDLIDRLTKVVSDQAVDVVLYGIRLEYDKGRVVRLDNQISEGFYDRGRIRNDVFPILLSGSSMLSTPILMHRVTKMFSKALLLDIMDNVSDMLTIGEDTVTSFAAINHADSLFCIREYYPYHYVRNSESMIGSYDPQVFEKLDRTYGALRYVAKKYGYPCQDQVDCYQLSKSFLFIKKELGRNPQGFRAAKNQVRKVAESESFCSCVREASRRGYLFQEKFFAGLILRKCYWLAYIVTRMSDRIKGIRL